MSTAFLYNDVFLAHDTAVGHPERAARLRAIVDRLENDGTLARCVRPEFSPAPLDAVQRVHAPDYVGHIEQQSALGRHFFEGPDTVGSAATYEAALMAAGAGMKAADVVMAGEAKNAFCAVRPPGHHAERSQAMGFCFFNNIAIVARHLQESHGIERVAIVDWDVHHGNGTQHTFYADASVLYASTHQFPHYPGTGARSETGAAEGKGFTLNIPMASGSTATDYGEAFDNVLTPALKRFAPDFVLISAGFDAHEADPLSGMRVTTEGFARMTRFVMSAADGCDGRVVSLLEGGYDLGGLSASVAAHVGALMEA
jgi:acetoin utilization deacetylase AcuC-like enzyme